MSHKISVFGNFRTVDFNFTLVFKYIRFNGNVPVTVLRFSDNLRTRFPHLDKLFIVTNPKRRTRTKVKHRLSAVGFALGVFTKKDIQPLVKAEIFPLVISEILQE